MLHASFTRRQTGNGVETLRTDLNQVRWTSRNACSLELQESSMTGRALASFHATPTLQVTVNAHNPRLVGLRWAGCVALSLIQKIVRLAVMAVRQILFATAFAGWSTVRCA
jgi:hypothetical protein